MEKLTSRQVEALEFIKGHIRDNGTAPTLRELCEHMGYKAVGSAQDIIAALRRKGFLQQPTKQSARSLLLTEMGRSFNNRMARVVEDVVDAFVVPCLGSVPAGNPLEAIEDAAFSITVSSNLLPYPRPQADQLFGLRAHGDSMTGAGIFDGDWLIVKSVVEAEEGSIVIARISGEATVKRLMRDESEGWYLKPENPRFTNIYPDGDQFEVVGKVVALQRSFR